ncbi:hypothetical protein D3C86_2257720 [compost metagenome]
MVGLREMMNAYTAGLDEETRDMLCANLRILRENLRRLDPCVAGKEKGAKE